MYLHLGQDSVIRNGEIIGIFDLENTSVSKHTREYLKRREKEGQVINVSTDIPKSFIVTEGRGKLKVYISQISPATLIKRKNFIESIKEQEK